jgi:hypothetical protein
MDQVMREETKRLTSIAWAATDLVPSKEGSAGRTTSRMFAVSLVLDKHVTV